MPSCALCARLIPASQMRHSVMAEVYAGMPGLNAKTMPNAMEEIAMKCNRCGEWICNKCSVDSAMKAGAGSIRHMNCGGMFETP